MFSAVVYSVSVASRSSLFDVSRSSFTGVTRLSPVRSLRSVARLVVASLRERRAAPGYGRSIVQKRERTTCFARDSSILFTVARIDPRFETCASEKRIVTALTRARETDGETSPRSVGELVLGRCIASSDREWLVFFFFLSRASLSFFNNNRAVNARRRDFDEISNERAAR